ncbi:hypothetical protein P168DRAFT_292625 [Aspergillus campestris IBT 28561]|uniref:RRM domain-containing protein n=1 Tax=Aspergillus campestris (strain IBT 28561) TaxID=1392248 RepID=A0A2I1CV90_ASPC2|nr:uncharacterized protein P168DRAFT_292625 [Aspergillus campestris IBT 28561]PKY01524.1 hypothetical protein P168DRAFT_292625 [Aspergillus campestris IBT 28561]
MQNINVCCKSRACTVRGPPGALVAHCRRGTRCHVSRLTPLLAKLKESLLKGGLSPETLNMLTYGGPTVDVSDSCNSVAGHEKPMTFSEPSGSPTGQRRGASAGNYRQTGYDDDDNSDEEDDEVLLRSHETNGNLDYGGSSISTESSPSPADQRTVLLRGLPDKVTHKDIVDVMRGGALLHIYLRAREHSASVSFVEEPDAQEFLNHCKTYGLYVGGKRTEVLWNDRQFYLPPYVRAKVKNGASRNLVIYNVKPNVTEDYIRRDLEHIHNLIVITVTFKLGNAYISTNSIHNALFARSCMMSRLTYKGMRIGFTPDECTGPLVKAPTGPKSEVQAAVKKPAAVPNRFQLLSMEEADNDDSDQDGVSNGLHGLSLDGTNWADRRISA